MMQPIVPRCASTDGSASWMRRTLSSMVVLYPFPDSRPNRFMILCTYPGCHTVNRPISRFRDMSTTSTMWDSPRPFFKFLAQIHFYISRFFCNYTQLEYRQRKVPRWRCMLTIASHESIHLPSFLINPRLLVKSLLILAYRCWDAFLSP